MLDSANDFKYSCAALRRSSAFFLASSSIGAPFPESVFTLFNLSFIFVASAIASSLNDEPASPLIPPKKSFAPVFAKSAIAAFVSLTFAIKVSKFFVFSYSTNSIGVNGSPFNSLYALCALIRALVKNATLVL